MAIEIERKFLVSSDAWRSRAVSVTALRQGYVAVAPDRSVRVRISGAQAWLTLKFGVAGPVRHEFEYPVPLTDAEAILSHAADVIDKDRHIVPWQELTFEVDLFHGRLEGLVIAELETEDFVHDDPLPDWIGREVTNDPRYYNAVLVRDGLPEDQG
jgi:CYTH domain-containing protein